MFGRDAGEQLSAGAEVLCRAAGGATDQIRGGHRQDAAGGSPLPAYGDDDLLEMVSDASVPPPEA